MTEFRPGEGGVFSPVAAKSGLGRSFQRPGKHHQGKKSDPTAWAAEIGQKVKPTKTELEILFQENPSEVRALRGSGMSDDQIYDILNKRS